MPGGGRASTTFDAASRTWMAGTSPLLSGLDMRQGEGKLGRTWWRGWVWWRMQQGVQRAALHDGGADQSEGGLYGEAGAAAQLCQPDQQEGDQRRQHLQDHGIAAGAEKVVEFQVLLHPLEEQLDLPARFVEIGDFGRRGLQIVGHQGQHPAAA